MDGNGALFGTLQGNTRDVLHKFTVDLPKKHGRGGQSALRFARLRYLDLLHIPLLLCGLLPLQCEHSFFLKLGVISQDGETAQLCSQSCGDCCSNVHQQRQTKHLWNDLGRIGRLQNRTQPVRYVRPKVTGEAFSGTISYFHPLPQTKDSLRFISRPCHILSSTSPSFPQKPPDVS